MSRGFRRTLLVTCTALLSACAVVPSSRTHAPAAPLSPSPAPPPPTGPQVAGKSATASVPADTWMTLRSSFAMDDCDADPAIMTWARRYTRNPAQFESQLREALPRLAYVQKVAKRYAVPGEFVLLPWVESGFSPVRGHRNKPAGMWQIVPATAGAMGLRVDGMYDARLDVPAAAAAVMKLLKQYHEQFHDWRVVDYAYNAGEFTVRRLVRQKGLPPASPVIPQWHVHRVTREHLARLLGMACVVREPGRFHVTLPVIPDELHLVQVDIPHSMKFAKAADHAGMSVDALKDLNGAFRHDMIDTDASAYLLLPMGHVRQFRNALMKSTASNDTTLGGNKLPAAAGETDSPGDIHRSETPVPGSLDHRVKKGESLWQIAHRYAVTIGQLQRWNHLRGHAIKPGQILHIERVQ